MQSTIGFVHSASNVVFCCVVTVLLCRRQITTAKVDNLYTAVN